MPTFDPNGPALDAAGAIMSGAADALRAKEPERERAPLPPADFAAAVQREARILAAGYRRPPITGMQIFDMQEARKAEVRAAFNEGCAVGSEGWLHRDQREKLWRASAAYRALADNPPGMDIVGALVVSSDPRAAGRETWQLLAIRRDSAWIRAEGVDLIVPTATIRDLIGRSPL